MPGPPPMSTLKLMQMVSDEAGDKLICRPHREPLEYSLLGPDFSLDWRRGAGVTRWVLDHKNMSSRSGLHAKLRAFAIKSVHDVPNPFAEQRVGCVCEIKYITQLHSARLAAHWVCEAR